MKKFIYIAVVALFSGAFAFNPTPAVANGAEYVKEAGPRLKGVQVVCRVVSNFDMAYLIFQGPYMKSGDNVVVSIYKESSGELVQQEFIYTIGGGQMEEFSIEGIEPGSYFMDVEGDIYNKEYSFVIP